MFRTKTKPAHSIATRMGAITCFLIASPIAANEVGEARDCVIVPHRIVDVSSAVPGLLESVSIERSDVVVSGQELARLESATERASVDLADAWASIRSEIQLESISQGLDRRRKARVDRLFMNNAVALDDKDQAETDASLAEVRLRQAREKRWIRELDAKKAEALLDRRTVRSPIDGVIIERFRSGGEYVENQPIARIAQLDPLQVETILPMRQFGSVQPGMQATVRAEHDPDKTFTATVSVVDKVGDAASGTFGVRLSLPNPKHEIPAGLKCTLNLLPDPVVAQSSPRSPTQRPATTTDSAPTANQSGPVNNRSAPEDQRIVPVSNAVPVQSAESNTAPGHHHSDPAMVIGASGAQKTTADAGQVCVGIGPLADAQAALDLKDRLTAKGATARLHEDKTRNSAGFIVISTSAVGDTAQLIKRMRAAGVHDLQPIHEGDFRGQVALGVYSHASAAARRRDAIAKLGFASEVRKRNNSRWWITLGPTADSQAAAHTQAILGSVPQSTDVTLVPCNKRPPLSADKQPAGDAEPRV